MPSRTPIEIQQELAAIRAELVASVDELSSRLDPRVVTQSAVGDIKAASTQVRARIVATAAHIKEILLPDDEEDWAFEAATPQEEAERAAAAAPGPEPYPMPAVITVLGGVTLVLSYLVLRRIISKK